MEEKMVTELINLTTKEVGELMKKIKTGQEKRREKRKKSRKKLKNKKL